MAAAYDVIVVGLGAMGSATCYQAARRGARVLGLERFTPAHELGSSGGITRIIRLAYFEHPAYVPLLRAAWDLWPRIAEEADKELLLKTGGLYVGRRGSAVLEGSLASAREHGLAHEMLSAAETRARFPALVVDDDMETLHEPLAGMLFAQRCITAHLELAARHDAELHFEERVVRWTSDGDGIRVETDRATYTCARLVLAAGAWLPALAPDLQLPLNVERNVLFWFAPVGAPRTFAPDQLPVWIVELDDEHAYYGFPALPPEAGLGEGVKVARHHGGRSVEPDSVDRAAGPEDEAPVRDFMRRHMPLANGERLDARVCMYTNTPDFNFVLDFHPADQRVVVASPCSGHGFKFSNVIGRICAQLALDGRTDYDIGFLSLKRFGTA